MKTRKWKRVWINLPISRKLTIAMGGILGIVVITTLVSTSLFFSMTQNYKNVLQKQEAWFSQQEIKHYIYARINSVLEYITTGKTEYLNKYYSDSREVQKIEQTLLDHTPPNQLHEVEEFMEASEDWEFLLENKVIPVYQLGNREDAWLTLTEEAEPIALTLIDAVNRFTEMKEDEILNLSKENVKRGQSLVFFGIAITLFSIFLALVLAWILKNSMVKPILLLNQGTRRLSEGDLDYRVTIDGHDEFGQLGEAFNQMGNRLNGLIRKLNETNQRLVAESRNALAANRLKSEFLATISHELRTPLNGIIGFAEVLKEGLFGPLNAKQQEYVTYIVDNANHQLDLINDLLDLSKIEAGKMELHLHSVDVESFFAKTLVVIQERAKNQGISLSYKNLSSVEQIELDPKRVTEIMNNLLSNAVKFTPKGGAISVTIRQSREFLLVSVQDTGIGIRKKSLEKIFLPFYQDEGALDRRFDGTGLGLNLTRRLVELHGGEITVESEVGKGTTFTFSLPLKQIQGSHENSANQNQPLSGDKEDHDQSLVIWLIGDEDPLIDMLRERVKGYAEVKHYSVDEIAIEWESEKDLPRCVLYLCNKTSDISFILNQLLEMEWLKWVQDAGIPVFLISGQSFSPKEKGLLYKLVKEIIYPDPQIIESNIKNCCDKDGKRK